MRRVVKFCLNRRDLNQQGLNRRTARFPGLAAAVILSGLFGSIGTVAFSATAHAFDAAAIRQVQDRSRRNGLESPFVPRVPRNPAPRGSGAARDAVQRGEILPLEQVMARVQGRFPGRLLDVRLNRSNGRWTYYLKMLTHEGRVLNVAVDARTARILGVAGNR